MAEVISLEDVYTAMCSSKPTLYKAILGLILSSGMNPTTISKLTLNDFLVACDDYFEDGEEKSLENLLKKNPWKIIPCWKVKSKNIISFNTPETTFYLFLYLKEKRMDDLSNLEYPLFKSGDKNCLTSSKISSYITEFNSIISLFKEDYENKFKSKNLIATFRDIYDRDMLIEINNKNNLIQLFEGKLSNKSKFYRNSMENHNEIKEYYKLLIPSLTAREYNLNNEKPANNNLNDKKSIAKIIQDFYNTELKDELDLDYGQEQLLCKFAEDLSEHDAFFNNQNFLKALFKKALIKLKIHNHTFDTEWMSFLNYVDKDPNPEVYAKKLEEDIYKLEIYDLINISREEMLKLLTKHIVRNNYYNKPMVEFEAETIIEQVSYDLIDVK